MKKIAIAIMGILLALYLAAYRPWRTGGQAEKDSTGGLNVAQDGSRPATGASGANQSGIDVQQSVKEVKQRVTSARGAKRHGKGVNRSTAGMRQGVKQQIADIEVQVTEAQAVEQLIIDVRRPTEDVEVITIESEGKFEAPSVEPRYIETMKVSSDWLPARRINIAVPERQECFTPYVWVEIRDQ